MVARYGLAKTANSSMRLLDVEISLEEHRLGAVQGAQLPRPADPMLCWARRRAWGYMVGAAAG